MNRRIGFVVLIAAAITTITAALWLRFVGTAHSGADDITLRAAAAEENRGVLSRSDYIRLASLTSMCIRTRMISDTDLAWDLSILNAKPTVDNYHNESDLHALAIAPVVCASSRTPSQRTAVLKAVRPFSTDADRDASLRAVAVMVVGQTGGKSELPLLRGLLADRDAGVRSAAAQAVARIEAEEPALM